MNNDVFHTGRLAARLASRVERARATGALVPLTTDLRIIEEAGVKFPVRVLGNFPLKLRDPTSARPAGQNNPFLPPDPDLLVAGINDTHVAVLNKYPVIEGHLLLVTRLFERQESLLTTADFAASIRCLRELDGVLFYNSGRNAGASQPHRHLQLIPSEAGDVERPVEEIWQAKSAFRHARTPIDPELASAENMHERYVDLLGELGLLRLNEDPKAYNLLVTRHWMMVVPRTRECAGALSLNAMAFMGSLFVRDEAQLSELVQWGLFKALAHVSSPRD